MSGSSRRGAVRIDCSGWSYPDWRGPVHPPDLAPTVWLAHDQGSAAVGDARVLRNLLSVGVGGG